MHGLAVGRKYGDGQPRLVAHERVALPRVTTIAHVRHARPVHLLEKGGGLGSQGMGREQILGPGAEGRARLPEGTDAGKVARGEEMRQAGVFQERAEVVTGRITAKIGSGHDRLILSRSPLRGTDRQNLAGGSKRSRCEAAPRSSS